MSSLETQKARPLNVGRFAIAALFIAVRVVHCSAKQDKSCEQYKGRAFGLCNAFCKAQNCGLQFPNFDRSCQVLYNKFINAVGVEPPCVFSTDIPTESSTERPSERPSERPTNKPSEVPTRNPTEQPTVHPTLRPTVHPTDSPSENPSERPTEHPTLRPTEHPTLQPSVHPSDSPSEKPSDSPTESPSEYPSKAPSLPPSEHPSGAPSESPTENPLFEAQITGLTPLSVPLTAGAPGGEYSGYLEATIRKTGIISLADIADYIASVACSYDNKGAFVSVQLNDGYALPETVEELFGIGALLVIRGDFFGSCVLEPQSDSTTALGYDSDGYLEIVSVQRLNHKEIFVSGSIGSFDSMFEYLSFDLDFVGDRRSLLTVPFGPAEFKVKVDDINTTLTLKAEGSVTASITEVRYKKKSDYLDVKYRLDYSGSLSAGVGVSLSASKDFFDEKPNIARVPIYGISISFWGLLPDIRLGTFFELNGLVKLSVNAEIKAEGTYTYTLPANSLDIAVFGSYSDLQIQITKTDVPSTAGGSFTGVSKASASFSVEGAFGVTYGVFGYILSEEPVIQLSQDGGVFLNGAIQTPPFPPDPELPPFIIGDCGVGHMIEATLSAGLKPLTLKVEFEFDPLGDDSSGPAVPPPSGGGGDDSSGALFSVTAQYELSPSFMWELLEICLLGGTHAPTQMPTEMPTIPPTPFVPTAAPTEEPTNTVECITSSGQTGICACQSECVAGGNTAVPWWEGDPEPSCKDKDCSEPMQCCVADPEPCIGPTLIREGFCGTLEACQPIIEQNNPRWGWVPWEEGAPEPSCRRYGEGIGCCVCVVSRCRIIIGDDGGFP